MRSVRPPMKDVGLPRSGVGMGTYHRHSLAVDVGVRVNLKATARATEQNHPPQPRRDVQGIIDDERIPRRLDCYVHALPLRSRRNALRKVLTRRVHDVRRPVAARNLQPRVQHIHRNGRHRPIQAGNLACELSK